MTLKQTIDSIQKVSEQAGNACMRHWDQIAKPLKSLGRLEEAVISIAKIQNTPEIQIERKALIIMCADNGVVEEQVTQSGQDITAIVAENFLDEKSCVAIMCKDTGTDIFPIDIGMARDTPRVPKRKVMYGTRNITKEPAMSREETIQAVETGIAVANELADGGYQIFATGEMGIGNTTTSSAVASVLLSLDPELVTGRGAGLSDQGLQRKIQAIKRAMALHQPNREDVIDVLSKVGGLDIAGLTGVYLAGAARGIPVVMDGFISAVAALCAVGLAPEVEAYILASHVSKEPAGQLLLDALQKKPLLTLDMCLGEGSGAVALFPLLDLAVSIYRKMATFEEISMEDYVPQ